MDMAHTLTHTHSEVTEDNWGEGLVTSEGCLTDRGAILAAARTLVDCKWSPYDSTQTPPQIVVTPPEEVLTILRRKITEINPSYSSSESSSWEDEEDPLELQKRLEAKKLKVKLRAAKKREADRSAREEVRKSNALAEKAAYEAQLDDLVSDEPLLEQEVCADLRVVPTAKFRLNNQRLFLTYAKAELVKKDLEAFIRSKSKRDRAMVKIACESHKDGTKHMHVLVDFGDRFQSTSSRIFDFDGYHPNIRVVRDLIHWANLLCYLGKEDKSCVPTEAVQKAAKYWNCKTRAEVMLAGGATDPMKALAIWEQRPKRNAFVSHMPEPNQAWYQEICKPLIEGETDHRSWNWFMDPVGKSGKSYCCKYFLRSGSDDVRCTKLTCKTADDFANKLISWQESGWTGKVCIIDLARGKANTGLIYECLEMLSDGWGDTGKYKGGEFLLDLDPIVIILANWWPKISERTGSTDRWRVYQIASDDIRSARCMNLNIVRAERGERDIAAKVEYKELEAQAEAVVVATSETQRKYRRT